MIKTYTNIDPNCSMIKAGLKVKEISTGKKAKVTGVYHEDNEVWLVSGHEIGVTSIHDFWDHFEEDQS